MDYEGESDARTLLGLLLIQETLAALPEPPRLLMELLDPGNEALLQSHSCEALTTPNMLSHLMTNVTLRRELKSVFDTLLKPEGAETGFRPAQEYGLQASSLRFPELQRIAYPFDEIILGVRTRREGKTQILFNPDPETRLHFHPDDALIVLTGR
jgi:hypothetical protein